jgi:hypothetical protein
MNNVQALPRLISVRLYCEHQPLTNFHEARVHFFLTKAFSRKVCVNHLLEIAPQPLPSRKESGYRFILCYKENGMKVIGINLIQKPLQEIYIHSF